MRSNAFHLFLITMNKVLLTIWLITTILILSCRKDAFITSADARLRITADTLKFDTVFTSAGSVTQTFKIINENDRKLRISSIQLMGAAASNYKINVDGITGPAANNLELEPNDSLYVFVQVNVNPSAANLPFVIRDSIQVQYNGNKQQVQLEAWGQNAHFFRNKVIRADETWSNDLPYVILGGLVIDTNRTLTINKGCRIYLHADAPVIVDGTLQVNGLKDTSDRVWFTGDRLDDPYKNFPASWPGIFFRGSSRNNRLQYVMIKNAYQALVLTDPSPNANPKLVLNECVVDNAYDAGIFSVQSSINARNCLISNCGKNILLVKGGDYNFTHCTVASISNSFLLHKDPVLFLSNFISVNNNPVAADLNAVFRNCIFWGENGTVENEVLTAKGGSAAFNVNFDYNLLKVQATPANAIINQVISNQPPLFDSVNTAKNFYDFRLKTGSPALNKGVATTVTTDLDGKPRPVGLPDLGCFEKQ